LHDALINPHRFWRSNRNLTGESIPGAGLYPFLDTVSPAIHPYYMPVATLRLTTAEKRRFSAEARRRGLSLSEYLRRAGSAEAGRGDWKAFFVTTPPVALPPQAPTDLSSREGFDR
jgi:hypothetical protein